MAGTTPANKYIPSSRGYNMNTGKRLIHTIATIMPLVMETQKTRNKRKCLLFLGHKLIGAVASYGPNQLRPAFLLTKRPREVADHPGDKFPDCWVLVPSFFFKFTIYFAGFLCGIGTYIKGHIPTTTDQIYAQFCPGKTMMGHFHKKLHNKW